VKPGLARPAALHHRAHRLHRFHPAAVGALACPHCGARITVRDGALFCPSGHAFDVARQGYVALLGPHARTDTADTGDMVAARVDFLGAGHYDPIVQAIGTGHPGPVLEIGAGTGYYLRAALGIESADRTVAGIAIDSSKFAARRAAADPRVLSVLADAWSVLPLQEASVGSVLSVFAPRDPKEISRVLAPGGRLIAVTPTAGHLGELREKVQMLKVDDGKAERLVESFAGLLAPVSRQDVSFRMELHRGDVSALVRMGPTARHILPQDLQDQVAALAESETVTGAVTVSILEKTGF
jgi:23S rRNA (guanine745-N1)-methyltransferase